MEFDVVVIGGGPAGSATGMRLAAAGWRVALVERAKFPRRKVCGEYLSWTNWEFFQRLGVWDTFDQLAGPPVERVAFFARSDSPVTASLPSPMKSEPRGWGRALTRDCLDPLLLDEARRRGATVLQPWSVTQISRNADRWQVAAVEERLSPKSETLTSPVVILATGSWNRVSLDDSPKLPARPSDLLGFKAHFSGAKMPPDLLPLLAFPGGYGGMVTCQNKLVSLSCCVRRDVVQQLRQETSLTAGDAVLRHTVAAIPALRETLRGATRRGSWLAAGPIRPGRRRLYRDGMFSVGNKAGEAHPVVAEGISMAVQSGLLAADCLLSVRHRQPVNSSREIQLAGELYRKAWRRAFSSRIRASAVIAAWAMRPTCVRLTEPLVRVFPYLLTTGARLAGKSRSIFLEEKV